jgi:hypothetical protein
LFKSKDSGWLDIHWKNICPVDNSHNSLHFLCIKSNPDQKLKKNKKGSAKFSDISSYFSGISIYLL